MCGRFVASTSPAGLADFFGAAPPPTELAPSWNVAPTNDVYGVVPSDSTGRALEVFRWGLVPSWAKDITVGSRMINARAETVATKPSFSSSFRRRRLIVPMDGFYEWRAALDGLRQKVPVFIHSVDGSPLAVAGLWAAWRDPASDHWLHTCTVITTRVNAALSSLHDRMPVVLGADEWDLWLDPTVNDPALLTSLLDPAPDDLLTFHVVGTAVNQVRNKGPELIAPA